MTTVKYSLLAIFTIALIIIAWIFFTSNSSDKIPETEEIELAYNDLYNQTPKDNDADYSMPVYMPAHPGSQPRAKVEFKEGADNDALYSMPVSMPETSPAPVKKKAEKVIFAPEQPVAIPVQDVQPQYKQPAYSAPTAAPLQPRARQPETPVYVPQYQQPQYQPQYQQPVQQPQTPSTTERSPDEDVIPYYYY